MNILIVDDDGDTRALLRTLLSQEGHSPTAAASAAEALVHLKMRRYDLILLDIMLPGIDGLQFAQFLASRWDTFEIPVLVLSARSDEESKSWARLGNCVGYVEKPFGSSDLLERIAGVGADSGMVRGAG